MALNIQHEMSVSEGHRRLETVSLLIEAIADPRQLMHYLHGSFHTPSSRCICSPFILGSQQSNGTHHTRANHTPARDHGRLHCRVIAARGARLAARCASAALGLAVGIGLVCVDIVICRQWTRRYACVILASRRQRLLLVGKGHVCALRVISAKALATTTSEGDVQHRVRRRLRHR